MLEYSAGSIVSGADSGRSDLAECAAGSGAEAIFESFFALSSQPMTIRGRDGRIQHANAAMERSSGYTSAELLSLPAGALFHEDDRAAALAGFQKLLDDGGEARIECRGIRRDGAVAWLLLNAAASPDRQSVYTVTYDITEHKLDQEALRQSRNELELHAGKLARSNAELERFAYVASHDLQEPLRMVTGFTQLLSKRYSGRLDETAERYINYAVDGAKRMQRLISDLLAYSRVNSKELDLRPIECEAAVRAAMRNLQSAILEGSASIEWDSLPCIQGDLGQLTQLFQNLLGNAIKFRRPGEPPRIRISAVDNGAEYAVAVMDNGIGIEPRHTTSIFQPFRRLHGSAAFPGSGIGLAICKTVVERNGGRIWAESRQGEGATFRFTLPKG